MNESYQRRREIQRSSERKINIIYRKQGYQKAQVSLQFQLKA